MAPVANPVQAIAMEEPLVEDTSPLAKIRATTVAQMIRPLVA